MRSMPLSTHLPLKWQTESRCKSHLLVSVLSVLRLQCSVPQIKSGFQSAQTFEGKGWCKDATLAAITARFRHLDCACGYCINSKIGEAIQESGVHRSEVFLNTIF
ncbi:hypothetical protein BKA64DRAFT_683568 [Cadophora sp. MPI-SDFR-AT-0126]|nr:hypothetical protein BKA64DRAFT_683568 [Leotiomycetes sp. MPI-SDFR-AT-0126]